MYDYPTLKTEEDENLKGIRIYIGHMCIATAPGGVSCRGEALDVIHP